MDEKEIFNNRYWEINKFMLKLVGLWPYQKRYLKILIRTFILVAIHSMMIAQMIRTFYEWGKNVGIVIENVAGFFYFEAIIAKYISNFVAEPKLQYLYEQISKDWKEFNDEGEYNVLSNFANQGRLLTIGYSVYMLSTGTLFVILPVFIPIFLDIAIPLNVSRPKMLCFYGEYFVDQEVYYYQLLLHTGICVIVTVLLFATIDSAYTGAVQHVIGLFNIADYRLKQAFRLVDDKNIYKSVNTDNEIHHYVVNSIIIHNKSIEFVDLVQSTYTLCFFLTTGFTLACLSLATVDLMYSVDDYIAFSRMFFGWVGVIIYLFYVSIPGQKIFNISSDIFHSAYFCGWYKFPLKTQRLIKFMMLRCSVPCQLTAGPLIVLNLENCGIILKTAMSYCTFITAMS